MATAYRRRRRLTGRPLLLFVGALYLAFAVVRTSRRLWGERPTVSVLVVALFVGGSGLVLLVGGYRLPATDVDPRFYPTITTWTLGGFAVIVCILFLYDLQPDTGISEPARSVPILTGFSCVAGYGVGMYAAHARTRAYELEVQNRRLERVQDELEASNERLEQFAYAVSHDLKEPLRMVSSYLQLLESRYGDALDEDGEEFLEYAVDGADRMREMIDALLEYSRVETRGESFEPVDLETAAADARKDLEVRVRESGAEIEIGDLPTVSGDPDQLRQVFQNLLDNAIEYSGDEPPRIEVTASRTDPGGQRADDGAVGDDLGTDRPEDEAATWTIAVRDEGIGIDPDDQERIFEVFQRLHTQADHAGTGIGLALCERIVERHGGDIWVDSEPGEGTTVSFTLPAADSDGAAPVASVPAGAGRA